MGKMIYMQTPLISIIMPAYNTAQTIGHSLRSVLAQSEPRWELLIVDDASTDNTAVCVRAFLEEEAMALSGRARLLQLANNRGVAHARNKGIAEAMGDWIAFLDSDDVWEPDKLRAQLELTEKFPQGKLFYTGSGFMNAEGEHIGGYLSAKRRLSYRQLLRQNIISCSSVLVRHSVLVRAAWQPGEYFPDTRRLGICMHEDYPLWLAILRDGGVAYGVDKPLLIYRLSENSQSSNKKKAAAMTYAVYAFIGIPLVARVYYFAHYVLRSLWKYAGIRK